MISTKNKKIKITPTIAELCGIIAGDGHLSFYKSKDRTDYKVTIVGHKNDDIKYLKEVQKIIHIELKIKPKLKIGNNYCALVINSKKILYFFNDIGIPIGNKSAIISIPQKIKKSLKLSCNFLRGLADTDFSLVYRKRKTKEDYPRITTSLKSKKIIKDICSVLQRIGIKYCGPYRRDRVRNNTPCITYQIDINGHKNFSIWMNKIGFRNQKHLKKIKRKAQELPPANPLSRT